MNKHIIKTFIGKHIDLSKVVSISDAYFEDNMGYGGYFASFEIDIQLRDEPIKYNREFKYDEYDYHNGNHTITLFDGRKVESSELYDSDNHYEILAVRRLQQEINELIDQWKTLT